MLAWLGWIFLHPAKQLLVLNLGAKSLFHCCSLEGAPSYLTPTFRFFFWLENNQTSLHHPKKPPWDIPNLKRKDVLSWKVAERSCGFISQLFQWVLGGNASQVLLVPVAKGIFLELGEIEGLGFGAEIWGWDLCGIGSCAICGRAAASSWLCFISQNVEILNIKQF